MDFDNSWRPRWFDVAPRPDVTAFVVPAASGQEELAAGMALAGRLARHVTTSGPAPFELTVKEYELLRRVIPGVEASPLWTGSAMTNLAEVPLVVVDPEAVERDRRRARQRQEAIERLLG